ncbi:MAG: cyclic nucleotide-binding domain-containing protein [Sideroxydans sp.]|nr:cyclic nucleotide-binding domain-containing protein [Sideroxydans sp.]
MSESKIYARTEAGNTELTMGNGKIAGDEKRLMLLVDGKASVEDIGKKVPPSVRKHIDEVFELLRKAHFIKEVGKVEILAPLKHPSRVAPEKVQEAMLTSQKFNVDMLALAEIEIERRMELEQELEIAQTQLAQANQQLATVTASYNTLKEQVTLYKQGMEAKLAAQHAQLAELLNQSQASQAQKTKLQQAFVEMRSDFNQMQTTLEEKNAQMDEAVQVRVLQKQQAELEKRKQEKVAAEEKVMQHPRYKEVRNLDFFKNFRNSDLAQLLTWAEWREAQAGEVVISEGQADINFYILVSGKVALLKGKKTLSVIATGEPFGEIAFLSGDEPKRTATIKARTDCTLLMFNPAYLDDAELMMRVLVAESFMRIQAKRLRTASEQMSNLLNDGED